MPRYNIDINGTVINNCNKIKAFNIDTGNLVEFSSKSTIESLFNNNLETLDAEDFGNATTIITNQFINQTKLTEVTLPSSITNINTYAFYNCHNLKTINFNYVENIDIYAFQDTAITDVKDFSPTNGIISNSCFQSANITDLIICAGVTTIRSQSFYNNPLKTILLPSSISSIGSQGCFGRTPAQWIKIEKVLPPKIDSNSFNIDKNTTLIIPKGSKALYENASNYAQFKKIEEYEPEEDTTYTFEVTGGSLINQSNTIHTKLPIFEEPKCVSNDSSKIFLGWYVNDELIEFPYLNKTDVTLIAKFGFANGSSRRTAIDVSSNIGLYYDDNSNEHINETQITIDNYFNENIIYIIDNNWSGNTQSYKWYKFTPQYSGNYTFYTENYYHEIMLYDSLTSSNYISHISTYNDWSNSKNVYLTGGNTYYFVCGAIWGDTAYLTITGNFSSSEELDDIGTGLLKIENLPDNLSLDIYGVADDSNSYVLLNNVTNGLYNLNSRFSTLSYLHGYTFSNKNIFMKLNLPNNYPEGNIPNVSVTSYYPNQNAAATEDDIETIFAQDESDNWYIFDNDNSGFSFDSAGYGYKVEFTEKTFTVTYKPSNNPSIEGTIPVDNNIYHYGDTVTLDMTPLGIEPIEADGEFIFYGWAQRKNVNIGPSIDDVYYIKDINPTTTITGNMELYPVFIHVEYGAITVSESGYRAVPIFIDDDSVLYYEDVELVDRLTGGPFTITYAAIENSEYYTSDIPTDNTQYHYYDTATLLFTNTPTSSLEGYTFYGYRKGNTNWAELYPASVNNNTFMVIGNTILYPIFIYTDSPTVHYLVDPINNENLKIVGNMMHSGGAVH